MPTQSLRIVADDAIPDLQAAFGSFAEITTHPGRALRAEHVAHADVLLVRTTTRVDAELLATSAVRFVGSATAGVEHIDREYLARRGIAFAHAPGANAVGVVEYVLTAIVLDACTRPTGWLRHCRLGIVGLGHVGRRLAERARSFGLTVHACDPPLQREARGTSEGSPASVPLHTLSDLLARSDVVTVHVPLTRRGRDATWNLIDEGALARFGGGLDGGLVIQTSRGGVVSEAALRAWFGPGRRAVLDVWRGEPDIDFDLVQHPNVRLATPHIAGYTAAGKHRATWALATVLAHELQRPAPTDARPDEPALELECPRAGTALARLAAVLERTNPLARDDAALRSLAGVPPSERGTRYDGLRRHYRFRPEFSQVRIRGLESGDVRDETLPCSLAHALRSLGFTGDA